MRMRNFLRELNLRWHQPASTAWLVQGYLSSWILDLAAVESPDLFTIPASLLRCDCQGSGVLGTKDYNNFFFLLHCLFLAMQYYNNSVRLLHIAGLRYDFLSCSRKIIIGMQ